MKYALIIGNDQYTDEKLAQLKTPAEDARDLEKVLSDENIGGFNAVPLVNKTGAEIRLAISEFLGDKKPDDLVLIYFSGHGILDRRGRLFLAFKDTKTSVLTGSAIPSSFIADEMDSCRSKRQILILDCCQSGAFAREGKKTGDQKAITEATFEGSGSGRAVLTASDSTQFALEGDQVIPQTHLSLFTHFLIEGLITGEADIDNDGNISLDEWYEYTHFRVVSSTSEQIPQKWAYQQQGDLFIAKNPKLKKRLPVAILDLVNSPIASARAAAVRELSKLLQSRDVELSESARQKLDYLKGDTHQMVSAPAKKAINEFEQSFIGKSRKSSSLKSEEKTYKVKKPVIEAPKPTPIVTPPNKIISPNDTEKKPVIETPKPIQVVEPPNKITFSNSMGFMRVPAGKFLMGSENVSMDIPYNYWMGQFLVTNALYSVYTKAKKIDHPGNEWTVYKNHPVVRVLWEDILNYCKWLDSLLKSEMPSDVVFRLPTEAEWEKAARGTDGRYFPWGNEFDKSKCNINQNNTTPVGSFSPQGDSPFGCADMAGNVWERTHSLMKEYPYDASDGREDESISSFRVLRGGSYINLEAQLRCFYRLENRGPIFDLTGFRICLAPPLPK